MTYLGRLGKEIRRADIGQCTTSCNQTQGGSLFVTDFYWPVIVKQISSCRQALPAEFKDFHVSGITIRCVFSCSLSSFGYSLRVRHVDFLPSAFAKEYQY